MVEWSSLLNNKLTVSAAAVTTAAVIAAVVYLSKRKQKQFELVGKVSQLNCYPIKSCQGISNHVAFCTVSGLRMANAMDRHFVIVRPNGDFVTQRQISKMAGIRTSCDDQDLILNGDDMPELRVPLYPKLDHQKVEPCRVWVRHMEAQHCGQEADSWISKYLKEDLKLLAFVQGLKKWQSPAPNAIKKDQIVFPDQGPYLIATEESLADLQSRIGPSSEGDVTMKNFRPNIVIQGTKRAWDEDNWSHLKIGKNLELRVLSPCERCVLTTVNPEVYERRSDQEPLKTLQSFRIFPKIGKGPLFGVFAGVDVESTIYVGDPVYALRK